MERTSNARTEAEHEHYDRQCKNRGHDWKYWSINNLQWTITVACNDCLVMREIKIPKVNEK